MNEHIKIIQFEENGVPDTDMSIIIPEGDLKTVPDKYNVFVPQIITFREKDRGGIEAREFPAVQLGNLYFVWIENFSKWICIYFYAEYSPEKSFTSGVEADNTTAEGPFEIGIDGAKIIKSIYGSSLPLDEIVHTSPQKLSQG